MRRGIKEHKGEAHPSGGQTCRPARRQSVTGNVSDQISSFQHPHIVQHCVCLQVEAIGNGADALGAKRALRVHVRLRLRCVAVRATYTPSIPLCLRRRHLPVAAASLHTACDTAGSCQSCAVLHMHTVWCDHHNTHRHSPKISVIALDSMPPARSSLTAWQPVIMCTTSFCRCAPTLCAETRCTLYHKRTWRSSSAAVFQP